MGIWSEWSNRITSCVHKTGWWSIHGCVTRIVQDLPRRLTRLLLMLNILRSSSDWCMRKLRVTCLVLGILDHWSSTRRHIVRRMGHRNRLTRLMLLLGRRRIYTCWMSWSMGLDLSSINWLPSLSWLIQWRIICRSRVLHFTGQISGNQRRPGHGFRRPSHSYPVGLEMRWLYLSSHWYPCIFYLYPMPLGDSLLTLNLYSLILPRTASYWLQ